MAEVLESRQKWRDGLITLGDFLAVLNRFLDGPPEEEEPEETP